VSRVVCVGLAVMDIVFEVSDLPATAGKHFADGLRYVGGGPAANAAVTVARLGGDAALVASVGADLTGQGILDELRAEHVDTDHVRVVEGAASPTSAVLVDGAGERMIVNHLDVALHAAGAPAGTAFATADVVLADLRWPAGAEVGLREAASRGAPGVLDYDVAPPFDDEPLLTTASHIACSAPALGRRTGTDDPVAGLRQLAELTDAWLAVTVGDEGAYWLEDGEVHHQPAFDVEVIDTLGAGDVFHGVLALALADGLSAADAVRRASAAAALKCTRPGGRAGIPDAAALADFERTRGR
jgi:sulfofructose kinase